MVAVGQKVYYSPKWKTFPDFLSEYLKIKLTPEWGNAEIAKPLQDRHPIMQWYDEYCNYQRRYFQPSGEVCDAPMIGVVYCYLGLAYSLYLLDHNVELQARLIKRLKDPSNFQGAYYELIVANSLIRAGFDLVLEDEEDKTTKHCEFASVSKKTGKRYWVEAKMRGIVGSLGKTENDGAKKKKEDPASKLIKHLNEAFRKPAPNERLIFIDLNTASYDGEKPAWAENVIKKLDRYEKGLEPDLKAYVFVTNMPFHLELQSEQPKLAVLTYGLGIPDFSKPGYYRLSEIYRQKQKHIDGHDIMQAFAKYPQLPPTFDGSLPSRLKCKPYERIIIGEKYFFDGIDGKGAVATITTATVDENAKIAYFGTSNGQILTRPMSDDELNDYKRHPEAFFGRIQPVSKTAKSLYEMFEFFLEAYKNTPKERLLDFMRGAADYSSLQQMDQADLAIEYAERCCAAIDLGTPKK